MTDYFELNLLLGLIPALTLPALLGIASYVLSSLALYTMARRRGIHNPWLSWIPVVNVWILGSLSDQYRYVKLGQNRSKRKSLLILKILSAVLSAVMAAMAIGMVVDVVWRILGGSLEYEVMEILAEQFLGILALCLPAAAIGIAQVVIYYMALYDVYKSMDPANTTVFLVLSILFNITEPFFLFFNRNKDLGMPPRRDEPVFTSQESWENQ